jgi:hypothetical protein
MLSSRRIASSIETETKSPTLNLITSASSGFDKIKDQCSRTSRALRKVSTAEQKLMTEYLGDFLISATDFFRKSIAFSTRLLNKVDVFIAGRACCARRL